MRVKFTFVVNPLLNMLYMNAGDIWYLRQLLIHRSDFYSYDDLKTWNGTLYATFQEAAKASGIIENEAECVMCFTETYCSQHHQNYDIYLYY